MERRTPLNKVGRVVSLIVAVIQELAISSLVIYIFYVYDPFPMGMVSYLGLLLFVFLLYNILGVLFALLCLGLIELYFMIGEYLSLKQDLTHQ